MQISIDIIAFDARSGPKRIECQCEMTGSLNSAAFLLKGDAGEDIPGWFLLTGWIVFFLGGGFDFQRFSKPIG